MRAPSGKGKSPDHFFKFIPPGRMSHVSIPKSFREYSRNKITALLRRGCQKWPVFINDKWVFEEGWENFVRENGVEDLDIVVFKHVENMVFDVMVFDHTCCEREYPTNKVARMEVEKACQKENSLQKDIRNKLIHKHSDTELRGLNTRSKNVKFNAQVARRGSKSLKEIEKTMGPDHDHHPYLFGTLNSAFSKYRLLLPRGFGKSIDLSNQKMILRNGKTQFSWTVEVKANPKKGKYCLGRGWCDFYKANGLKKGDHYKLEFVQTGIKPIANFYHHQTKPSETRGMVETKGLNRLGDFVIDVSRVSKVIPKEKAAHEYPHFKFTATAYSIKNCFVNVPMGFARSNGLKERKCEMIVMDEKQRLWPTKLSGSMADHVHITGIRDMFAANGLKEGDEFLLELVENGDKPLMNIRCMNKRHRNRLTRSSA